MRHLVHALADRSAVLTYGGLVLVGVGLVLIPLAFIDSRLVTGQPVWVKPVKFGLSTGIYLLTLAWLLGELRLAPSLKGAMAWAFTLCMWGEVLLIVIQSARGVPSHYNYSTPFNAAVFQAMAGLIAVNTLVLVVLTAAYVTPAAAALPAAYRWGVGLSLVLMLISGYAGSQMVRYSGHTLGAPQDEPGLPLLGWSTTGGDLRWAHFLGLHALQVFLILWHLLPGHYLRATVSLLAVAALGVLTVFTFRQALAGKPFLRLPPTAHTTSP